MWFPLHAPQAGSKNETRTATRCVTNADDFVWRLLFKVSRDARADDDSSL